ncbi:hypothetical protein [Flavobacterium phragmitis]|uniref:Uncharacterized protein n=1 Tax=Flavobacterium phragmitis TaxID=739143 RepID=A0A1I1S2H1_9FLAO|nr:hypothetical protein [Flavobacterium phragmitis]SFD37973.1 hypothetical protein SAMN05216297_107166 [Flavobacterium phragmitis]
MTSSKWYKTLSFFLKKGYINNGLTLPFLAGLYEENEITIEDLITEMCNINSISIQKCPRINEFVFGILILESKEELKHYKLLGGLFLLDNSLDEFNRIDDLINHFEQIYLTKINSNCFSKNNGRWGYYNENEKNHLKEVDIIK